jgi:hypothetical protein
MNLWILTNKLDEQKKRVTKPQGGGIRRMNLVGGPPPGVAANYRTGIVKNKRANDPTQVYTPRRVYATSLTPIYNWVEKERVGVPSINMGHINMKKIYNGVPPIINRVTSNTTIPFFNFTFDKGRLKTLVSWTLEHYGEYKTVELLEQLKKTGFEYATKAGISLGVEDLKIPPKKASLLLEAEQLTRLTVHQYQRGDITSVERFKRLIDTWHRTSEQLKQEVILHLEETDILNPVYMMAFSGARGNISQVRQLVGMRGLMSDPQGQIIDFPIRSNFREGLTLTEYIISSYGSRKGIVDTALRTANAGYLTRRLVDVAQHVIISHYDCGTQKGIFLTDMKEGGTGGSNKTILSLQNRLIGRVLARDIYKKDAPEINPPAIYNRSGESSASATQNNIKGTREGATGGGGTGAPYITNAQKILSRNQEISSTKAFEISQNTNRVFVRSSLTCNTHKLICQLCYGWSLAQGKLVAVGETVGVIAAQSIGEPGTQLTMRTFHTGGVFAGDVSDEIRAPYDAIVEYSNSMPGTLIRTLDGKIAFLTKAEGVLILRKVPLPTEVEKLQGIPGLEAEGKTYKIPGYTILFIRNKARVLKKQVVAQITNISTQPNMRDTAEYTIKSELEGLFYSKNLDLEKIIIGPKPKLTSGTKNAGLVDHKAMRLELQSKDWNFAWVLSGKRYEIPFFAPLFPSPGDYVNSTTIITQKIWAREDRASACPVRPGPHPPQLYMGDMGLTPPLRGGVRATNLSHWALTQKLDRGELKSPFHRFMSRQLLRSNSDTRTEKDGYSENHSAKEGVLNNKKQESQLMKYRVPSRKHQPPLYREDIGPPYKYGQVKDSKINKIKGTGGLNKGRLYMALGENLNVQFKKEILSVKPFKIKYNKIGYFFYQANSLNLTQPINLINGSKWEDTPYGLNGLYFSPVSLQLNKKSNLTGNLTGGSTERVKNLDYLLEWRAVLAQNNSSVKSLDTNHINLVGGSPIHILGSDDLSTHINMVGEDCRQISGLHIANTVSDSFFRFSNFDFNPFFKLGSATSECTKDTDNSSLKLNKTRVKIRTVIRTSLNFCKAFFSETLNQTLVSVKRIDKRPPNSSPFTTFKRGKIGTPLDASQGGLLRNPHRILRVTGAPGVVRADNNFGGVPVKSENVVYINRGPMLLSCINSFKLDLFNTNTNTGYLLRSLKIKNSSLNPNLFAQNKLASHYNTGPREANITWAPPAKANTPFIKLPVANPPPSGGGKQGGHNILRVASKPVRAVQKNGFLALSRVTKHLIPGFKTLIKESNGASAALTDPKLEGKKQRLEHAKNVGAYLEFFYSRQKQIGNPLILKHFKGLNQPLNRLYGALEKGVFNRSNRYSYGYVGGETQKVKSASSKNQAHPRKGCNMGGKLLRQLSTNENFRFKSVLAFLKHPSFLFGAGGCRPISIWGTALRSPGVSKLPVAPANLYGLVPPSRAPEGDLRAQAPYKSGKVGPFRGPLYNFGPVLLKEVLTRFKVDKITILSDFIQNNSVDALGIKYNLLNPTESNGARKRELNSPKVGVVNDLQQRLKNTKGYRNPNNLLSINKYILLNTNHCVSMYNYLKQKINPLRFRSTKINKKQKIKNTELLPSPGASPDYNGRRDEYNKLADIYGAWNPVNAPLKQLIVEYFKKFQKPYWQICVEYFIVREGRSQEKKLPKPAKKNNPPINLAPPHISYGPSSKYDGHLAYPPPKGGGKPQAGYSRYSRGVNMSKLYSKGQLVSRVSEGSYFKGQRPINRGPNRILDHINMGEFKRDHLFITYITVFEERAQNFSNKIKMWDLEDKTPSGGGEVDPLWSQVRQIRKKTNYKTSINPRPVGGLALAQPKMIWGLRSKPPEPVPPAKFYGRVAAKYDGRIAYPPPKGGGKPAKTGQGLNCFLLRLNGVLGNFPTISHINMGGLIIYKTSLINNIRKGTFLASQNLRHITRVQGASAMGQTFVFPGNVMGGTERNHLIFDNTMIFMTQTNLNDIRHKGQILSKNLSNLKLKNIWVKNQKPRFLPPNINIGAPELKTAGASPYSIGKKVIWPPSCPQNNLVAPLRGAWARDGLQNDMGRLAAPQNIIPGGGPPGLISDNNDGMDTRNIRVSQIGMRLRAKSTKFITYFSFTKVHEVNYNSQLQKAALIKTTNGANPLQHKATLNRLQSQHPPGPYLDGTDGTLHGNTGEGGRFTPGGDSPLGAREGAYRYRGEMNSTFIKLTKTKKSVQQYSVVTKHESCGIRPYLYGDENTIGRPFAPPSVALAKQGHGQGHQLGPRPKSNTILLKRMGSWGVQAPLYIGGQKNMDPTLSKSRLKTAKTIFFNKQKSTLNLLPKMPNIELCYLPFQEHNLSIEKQGKGVPIYKTNLNSFFEKQLISYLKPLLYADFKFKKPLYSFNYSVLFKSYKGSKLIDPHRYGSFSPENLFGGIYSLKQPCLNIGLGFETNILGRQTKKKMKTSFGGGRPLTPSPPTGGKGQRQDKKATIGLYKKPVPLPAKSNYLAYQPNNLARSAFLLIKKPEAALARKSVTVKPMAFSWACEGTPINYFSPFEGELLSIKSVKNHVEENPYTDLKTGLTARFGGLGEDIQLSKNLKGQDKLPVPHAHALAKQGQPKGGLPKLSGPVRGASGLGVGADHLSLVPSKFGIYGHKISNGARSRDLTKKQPQKIPVSTAQTLDEKVRMALFDYYLQRYKKNRATPGAYNYKKSLFIDKGASPYYIDRPLSPRGARGTRAAKHQGTSQKGKRFQRQSTADRYDGARFNLILTKKDLISLTLSHPQPLHYYKNEVLATSDGASLTGLRTQTVSCFPHINLKGRETGGTRINRGVLNLISKTTSALFYGNFDLLKKKQMVKQVSPISQKFCGLKLSELNNEIHFNSLNNLNNTCFVDTLAHFYPPPKGGGEGLEAHIILAGGGIPPYNLAATPGGGPPPHLDMGCASTRPPTGQVSSSIGKRAAFLTNIILVRLNVVNINHVKIMSFRSRVERSFAKDTRKGGDQNNIGSQVVKSLKFADINQENQILRSPITTFGIWSCVHTRYLWAKLLPKYIFSKNHIGRFFFKGNPVSVLRTKNQGTAQPKKTISHINMGLMQQMDNQERGISGLPSPAYVHSRGTIFIKQNKKESGYDATVKMAALRSPGAYLPAEMLPSRPDKYGVHANTTSFKNQYLKALCLNERLGYNIYMTAKGNIWPDTTLAQKNSPTRSLRAAGGPPPGVAWAFNLAPYGADPSPDYKRYLNMKPTSDKSKFLLNKHKNITWQISTGASVGGPPVKHQGTGQNTEFSEQGPQPHPNQLIDRETYMGNRTNIAASGQFNIGSPLNRNLFVVVTGRLLKGFPLNTPNLILGSGLLQKRVNDPRELEQIKQNESTLYLRALLCINNSGPVANPPPSGGGKQGGHNILRVSPAPKYIDGPYLYGHAELLKTNFLSGAKRSPLYIWGGKSYRAPSREEGDHRKKGTFLGARKDPKRQESHYIAFYPYSRDLVYQKNRAPSLDRPPRKSQYRPYLSIGWGDKRIANVRLPYEPPMINREVGDISIGNHIFKNPADIILRQSSKSGLVPGQRKAPRQKTIGCALTGASVQLTSESSEPSRKLNWATYFVQGPNKLVIKKSGQLIHMNKQKITIRLGQPIVISPGSIIHSYHGDFVSFKTPVITLTYQQLKTGDIVQGIPKIEQLFEARTTKRGRVFRDNLTNLLTGLFLKYYVQSSYVLKLRGPAHIPILNSQQTDVLTRATPGGGPSSFSGIQNTNERGYNMLQSTILLSQALKWAVKQSFYKIQQIIVDGILRVYRSQGVSISDKHVEIIVKQMTSKVRVINANAAKLNEYTFSFEMYKSPSSWGRREGGLLLETLIDNNLEGPAGLFPGEIVDLDFVENINTFLLQQQIPADLKQIKTDLQLTSENSKTRGSFIPNVRASQSGLQSVFISPIKYEPIVLGITRASLEVDSFLSAASFQQTTRVLSQAALYKRKDFVKGLKENILVGNLIPAGTGYLLTINF